MADKVKGPVEPRRRRGRTSRSRVSAKNQVTIPVDALRGAGMTEGDVVRFEVEAPGVVRIVRERDAELEARRAAIERMIGALPGYSAETDLEAMRDQWEDTEGRPWLQRVYGDHDASPET
jgi:bifunctional DNA-binding transcriptional regulator/antitoxin component of YhaV-PrlF toxin-antitoxin module